jgi:hypothetical protein
LEEAGCDVINVSNRVGRVKDFVADISTTSHTAVLQKKKVILLDPMDALFADHMAAIDILEALRDPARKTLPIVCAGFLQRATYARSVDALGKKQYSTFEFPRIEDSRAVHCLSKMYPDIGKSALMDTWSRSHGDFRACLAALAFGRGRTPCNHVKDIICDGVEAIRRILFDPSMTLQTAMRLYDSDSQLLHMGIFENYVMSNPDIRVCSAISDSFSCADIVHERLYGRQEFELTDLHAALVAGSAAVNLQPRPLHPEAVSNSQIEKVGTLWSRSNNQRSKQKSVRDLNFALIEAGWSPLAVPDIATLRTVFSSLVGSQRHAEIAQLAAEIDCATVLSIMRLFKTKYTQMDHGKVKRAHAALRSC